MNIKINVTTGDFRNCKEFIDVHRCPLSMAILRRFKKKATVGIDAVRFGSKNYSFIGWSEGLSILKILLDIDKAKKGKKIKPHHVTLIQR